jgi:hypothetical protein
VPDDLILVVLVDGGTAQVVYASHEAPNIRVIVVDYDDLSTENSVQGDLCSVTEMDLTEDDDYIAAVMEAL